jgi:hypothetical protein
MTHVGWLRSEQLANWMEAVHDDADIRSGYAYNESVSQCIGHAVCTQPCIDQLTSWISDENLKSPRNLYGRALLYNQADIIAATEPHLKGSDLQFENVLNIYKGAHARLHDPMQEKQLIDRLVLTTANVIGKSLAKTSQSCAGRYLSVSTGRRQGQSRQHESSRSCQMGHGSSRKTRNQARGYATANSNRSS